MRTLLFIVDMMAILLMVVRLGAGGGEEAAQLRLIEWYSYVDDGGLDRIVSTAARLMDYVLNRVLGEAVVSIRSFLVWTLGLGFVAAVTVGGSVLYLFSRTGFHIFLWGMSLVSIADYPALCVARITFRKIARRRSVVLWLAVYFIAAYISIGIPSSVAQYFRQVFVAHGKPVTADLFRAHLLTWPSDFIAYVNVLQATHHMNWLIGVGKFYLVLCFSTASLVLMMMLSWLVYLTRRWTKPYVLFVIGKIADAKEGALLWTTSILMALVGAFALLLP